MKKKSAIVFFLAFLFGFSLLKAQKINKPSVRQISSKIVEVIVYPRWAYVTRKAEITLSAGINKYSFSKLPPWIDEDSIQIKLKGKKWCSIESTSFQKAELDKSLEQKKKKIEQGITQFKDRIEDLEGEVKVFKEEKEYLINLKIWKLEKIPHESAVRKVEISELKITKEYIIRSLLENTNKINSLKRKIRELKPELKKKLKELQDFKNKKQLDSKEIIVEIQSKETAKASLSVSYLISGASWYPIYDARSKGNKNSVSFSCQAIVQQTTGEDWENASFTLSTVQPYMVRSKPVLTAWYITRTRSSKNIPGLDARQKTLNSISGKQSSFFETNEKTKKSYQNLRTNIQIADQTIRAVEERGATAELKIDGKYSLASDGKPVRMLVGTALLQASPLYSAVPVLSKSTYITAKIKNEAQFPLLPGAVKVYINGNFIGKSRIGFIAEGEVFELYLGLEAQIKVTRELDFKISSSSFSGKKKRLKVAYVIKVKNFYNSNVDIEVQDQIPVSQNKEVKIKLLEHKPTSTISNKGIIVWLVNLKPSEEKKLYYSFQISYPVDLLLKEVQVLESQLKKMKKK